MTGQGQSPGELIAARFNDLLAATRDFRGARLSHRRIASLVAQRLTVSGAVVPADRLPDYSVTATTLNTLAKAGEAHGVRLNTLLVLETFFEKPGHFQVRPQAPVPGAVPRPADPQPDARALLVATRISQLDAADREALERQVDRLLRASRARDARWGAGGAPDAQKGGRHDGL